ncbi:hypothetical protein KFL_000080460 [Klebsormidium nitens]|uniref:Tetraspanin family protein n=1 Tax=Klebsormidium nitens TaxID=105231 RepID=A0A1Y1HI41_KLENI|nr:hypothetical protein KFL_000080460 [Klebsormidium nitens]|eukprot:GAQ78140.1 hypothetical protein KFL_000080460 [Klebsormidium nitens]
MGCATWSIKWLNILTLLLSLPIIGFGIYLAVASTPQCYRFFMYPVLILGVLLLFLSLLGIAGAWTHSACFLWIYGLLMAILWLALLAFTIFSFIVTNDGAGKELAGQGVLEYRLQDYSAWLQKQVEKPSTWRSIKSCLQEKGYCQDFPQRFPTTDIFLANLGNLSPIESGCCRPPSSCGFPIITSTSYDTTTPLGNDTDCLTYSSNIQQECLDCNSCRAGFLQELKGKWKIVAIGNSAILALVLVVWCVSCGARREAKRYKDEDELMPIWNRNKHNDDL